MACNFMTVVGVNLMGGEGEPKNAGVMFQSLVSELGAAETPMFVAKVLRERSE